jgi:ComF family protein
MEVAIGWLAPPQCLGCQVEGAALCEACASAEVLSFGERCWQCNAISPGCRTCEHCRHNYSPRFVWITTNYEDLAQRLVKSYKFRHLRVAVLSIAPLMVDTFLSFKSDEDITQSNYLVVPVPTATKRIRTRGFDHSELLARTISRKLHLQFRLCLRRLGQVNQVGATRSIRLAQAEGQYFVKNKREVAGRNILLIDDVVTTGATLRAATKVLRAAGAKHVDALVFAKKL